MSTTIEVGKIINTISFKIDQNSYNRALKAIRKLSSEWSRATSKMSGAMAQGRAIGGGGSTRGGAGSSFRGPPQFSPGQNTRAQNKTARMEAQRLSRAESTISSGVIGRDTSFVSSYSKQISMLNAQLRNGAITTGIYNKQLNTMARDFRQANQEGKGLFGTLHSLRGEFVAFTASYTAFTGGAAVMQTGQMFQGIEASMAMTSDSSEEATQKMKFLKDESYRLGLDIKTAAQGFTQMGIAAQGVMDKGQTQELFTGYSEYATALGVTVDKYERGITAIGQMLGKQQIYSEELKQQLAENIPGAMQAFVKAAQEHFKDASIGPKEFFKLMEDGKLISKDIMPLVAKYFAEAARKGGALEKMLHGNRVALNRLTQTWKIFQDTIFTSGFGDALTKWFNQLAAIFKNSEGGAKTFGAALGAVMNQLLDKFTLIYDWILYIWLNFEYYILDNIPEGLKGMIGDFLAWAASILVVVKMFSKLYAIVKMIMGLGSLKKSLGMGGADSPTGKGGKGSKIMGGAIAATMVGPFVEDLMDWAIGDTDFAKWAKENTLGSLWEKTLTPTQRTDMRPSLQTPAGSPQPVEVGVKVNDGVIKDLIQVEYVKVMNEIASAGQ